MIAFYKYLIVYFDNGFSNKKTDIYYALDDSDLSEQFHKDHFNSDYEIIIKEPIRVDE